MGDVLGKDGGGGGGGGTSLEFFFLPEKNQGKVLSGILSIFNEMFNLTIHAVLADNLSIFNEMFSLGNHAVRYQADFVTLTAWKSIHPRLFTWVSNLSVIDIEDYLLLPLFHLLPLLFCFHLT